MVDTARYVKDATGSTFEHMKEGMKEMVGMGKDKAEDVKQSAQETGREAQHKGESTVERLKEWVGMGQEKAEDVAGKVSESAGDVSDKAREKGWDYKGGKDDQVVDTDK